MKTVKTKTLSILLCVVFALGGLAAAFAALLSGGESGSAAGVNNLSFAQVDGGLTHTIALTGDGRLFGWGTGNATGLNNSGRTDYPTEIKVELETGEWFTKIACSKNASAAITNKGNLYTWGNHMGHNENSSVVDAANASSDSSEHLANIPVPRKAETGASDRIEFLDIAAGDNHYIALIKHSDSSYGYGLVSWGKLDQMQALYFEAADGQSIPYATILRVQTTTESFKFGASKNVIGVAAGGNTSAVIYKDYKVYVFGQNNVGQAGLGQIGTLSPAPIDPNENKPTDCVELFTLMATNGIIKTIPPAIALNYYPSSNGYTARPEVIDYSNPLSVGGQNTLAVYKSGSDVSGTMTAFGSPDGGMITTGSAQFVTTANAAMPTEALDGIQAVAAAKGDSGKIYAALKGNDIYVWGTGASVIGVSSRQLSAAFSAQPILAGKGISFKSLFAGYSCIYALDTNGKIYVMGENNGGKLCNKSEYSGNSGGNGVALPVEITGLTDENMKSQSELADTFNINGVLKYDTTVGGKGAFVGKGRVAAGEAYATSYRINVSDLLKLSGDFSALNTSEETKYTETYDCVSLLRAGITYTTLYGATKTASDVLTYTPIGNGSPNIGAHSDYIIINISEDGAYLDVTFNKKASGTFGLKIAIGKFAGKTYDAGRLQSVTEYTVYFMSLNSRPIAVDPAPELPMLNPNIKAERTLNFDPATFFFDADGDVLTLSGWEGFPNEYAEYMNVNKNIDGTFTVTAKKMLPIGNLGITLKVKDNDAVDSNYEADARAVIRIVTTAPEDLEDGKDAPYAFTGRETDRISDREFYVIKIVRNNTRLLRLSDLFNDPTGISYITFSPLPGQDVNILDNPDTLLTPNTISLKSRNMGVMNYKLNISYLGGTREYYIRIQVVENTAPVVNPNVRNTIHLNYNISTTERYEREIYAYSEFFLPGTEGLDEDDDLNIIYHDQPVYKEIYYAAVNYYNDTKTIEILPRQNGVFSVYFAVSDGLNTSLIKIDFQINGFHEASKIEIRGKNTQRRDLQWFVNFINNDLNNEYSGLAPNPLTAAHTAFGKITPASYSDVLADYVDVTVEGAGQYLNFRPKASYNENGFVLVELISGGLHYYIVTRVAIVGLYRVEYDLDVAEYKAENKTSVLSITPVELATRINGGQLSEVVNQSNITIVSCQQTDNVVAVAERQKNTGYLLVRSKINGEQVFDVSLNVDGEQCFVSVTVRISGIRTLPTLVQYRLIFFWALLIAVIVMVMIFVMRFVRYRRKKRLYKVEYQKYKALVKMKEKTAVTDNERRKREYLAKRMGEKMELEKLRRQNQYTMTSKPTPKPREFVKQAPPPPTVIFKPQATAAPVPPPVVTIKPEPARVNYSTEREVLEEKIKSRLAAEEAAKAAEEQSKAAEEEDFQNMSKEERKKAELLKKLRAKYNKE